MYQIRRGKRTHHNQNVDQCTIYSKQNVYVSRELIVFTLCRLPRMHNYVQHTISPAARSTSHYINTIKIIIHLERVTSLIGNVYISVGVSQHVRHTYPLSMHCRLLFHTRGATARRRIYVRLCVSTQNFSFHYL